MSKLPTFIEQHRTQMPGNIPSARLCVDREQWLEVANAMHEAGALLLSLWGADDRHRGRGTQRGHARMVEPRRLAGEVFSLEAEGRWKPAIRGWLRAIPIRISG